MAEASLRQRIAAAKSHNPKPPSVEEDSEIEDSGRVLSVLDIIRVIITLIGASCALSYYITSGESYLWNYHPWILKPGAISHYFVRLIPSPTSHVTVLTHFHREEPFSSRPPN